MNLLALDTSSTACTVAVQFNGKLVSRHEERPREHTRLLIPMIRDVLDEENLKHPQIEVHLQEVEDYFATIHTLVGLGRYDEAYGIPDPGHRRGRSCRRIGSLDARLLKQRTSKAAPSRNAPRR